MIFLFSQLSKELIAEMKEAMNNADNVSIAPIHVVERVSQIMFIFFLYLVFSLPET
jgi:hypothetical protein